MNEPEMSSKKDTWLIVLFSVVGVVVSVVSFLIYFNTEHVLIVIGLCIADVVYSYFNAKQFFKSKDWTGARQILIPLLMLVYWAIIFAVICIGNAMLLEGSFSNQFFLYPVFLMPAFVFEAFLFSLIGMGM